MADSNEDAPPIDYGLMNEVDLDYGDIDHAHYDDHEVPEDHAGRGDSRTYFKPSEADRGIFRENGPRISYHKLEERNRGGRTDDDSPMKNEREGRRKDMKLLLSQMECRPQVREKSIQTLKKFDEIKKFDRGTSTEELMMAIVSLHANKGPMHRRRHIRREDKWKDIRDNGYEARKKKIKYLRVKLQEEGYI